MTILSFNDAFNARLRPSEVTAEDRAIIRGLSVQPDPLDHARDCHMVNDDMERRTVFLDTPEDRACLHLGKLYLYDSNGWGGL